MLFGLPTLPADCCRPSRLSGGLRGGSAPCWHSFPTF